MGIPNQTAQQHFSEIRKYQTERDWTYHRSDEHILKHAKKWIERSKEYEEECKKLNIWYVDTSVDREKVLQDTLETIAKKILGE